MALSLFLSPFHSSVHPTPRLLCSSSVSPAHLTPHSHLAAHWRRRTRFPCAVSSSLPGSLPSAGPEDGKWDASKQESLLKGGEQVTSVLEEMIKLLEDMEMDEASEAIAVEIAAQGVIGKRVDEMESGFLMALDYMIQIADKDGDDKVQVIGLLCRTPLKDSRQELLRRVAGGGGVFKGENDLKVHLPNANLNDIANQADDLLETMEDRPTIPDRKLLARLVLIREEARNMMGGGILDERNNRGLNTLPEAEVNFLSKLVSLRPGKNVQVLIKNVMLGKDDGADNTGDGTVDSGSQQQETLGGIAGRGSITGRRPRPVRPGMFLETVTKVLGGIYEGNMSGITAQHLEWVYPPFSFPSGKVTQRERERGRERSAPEILQYHPCREMKGEEGGMGEEKGVDLEDLRKKMAEFARERDWDQFHSPRNLLLALVGEIGELSEIFQWKGEVPKGLPDWDEEEKVHLGEELSDVLLYLVRLSDICGVDLGKAAIRKLELNAMKYPVQQCKGSSKKYNHCNDVKAPNDENGNVNGPAQESYPVNSHGFKHHALLNYVLGKKLDHEIAVALLLLLPYD
ncbi:hypothetical protein AXF42_Ash018418 [Apostasia shenzhenica]|uniref:Uncharacterized protein n=1 Tax=Apostasia shenzhenica TaxID=1088818 RepID=A0A2I0BEC0_9ASPA|nr:hypothetical protein AXF42_Ash018418 [Apostasia shenzhenica]